MKEKQTDMCEAETFQSSKLEQDRDETESLGTFLLETEKRTRVLPICVLNKKFLIHYIPISELLRQWRKKPRQCLIVLFES